MDRWGLALFVVLLVDFVLGKQNVCLYSTATNSTLKPLQLFNTDCTKNTSYCMNSIYKYSNFQYNGISALKPSLGEVCAFLTQSEMGDMNMVVMLNANKDVTSAVTIDITGASPAYMLLQDDPAPNDMWMWDSTKNSGNFSWTTKPGYTDGVIIGNINFIDNYCVSSSFSQLAGAISTVSILTGSTKSVQRAVTVPYFPGSAFTFCQYPVTSTSYANASCPGVKDGSANLHMVFGPTAVSYRWYNSAGTLVANTASVSNLGGGIYTVYVNDSSTQGCDAVRTVTIYDHGLNGAKVSTTPFACSTTGSATAIPDGGSSPFTYLWFKSGATTPIQVSSSNSISGLTVGNYFVRVIDSCNSTKDINFMIATTGCCGDGICQANEVCPSANFCAADCGVCCQPGTYKNGNQCTVCPPGSFSTTSQAASCTSCPANTFNAGGSDACAPCPANYRSDKGSGKCDRCPAGTVRQGSASSCSTCNAGSYAPPCDDSDCTSCPAGTMSANAGAYSCTSCPAGAFSANGGSSTCSSCPVSSYSTAGASSCTACPSGTTTMDVGATHFLACN